jgi:hypothetical protein
LLLLALLAACEQRRAITAPGATPAPPAEGVNAVDASPSPAVDGGPGATPDVAVPADSRAQAPAHRIYDVAIGDSHACVQRDDHTVRCWGQNVTERDRPQRRPVRGIAAGGSRTCAILDDGSVSCWLPAKPEIADFEVSSGPDRPARLLAMNGGTLACAVFGDQLSVCWDFTNGDGTTTVQSAYVPPPIMQLLLGFQDGTMALFNDGTVTTPSALRLGPASLVEGHGSTAIASCRDGTYGWCAALQNGNGVHCEGVGFAVPKTESLTALVQGGTFLCGLRLDGTVSCWGNLYGCDDASPARSYWCEPGRDADGGHAVALGQPAIALAAGTSSSVVCAALADGNVKCWGTVPCASSSSCSGGDAIVGTSVAIDASTGAYGAWRPIDLDGPP